MTFATMPAELYFLIGLFLLGVLVIIGDAIADHFERRTQRARHNLRRPRSTPLRDAVDADESWGELLNRTTDWSAWEHRDRRAA